jgi:pyruvate dehydrogenase E2 component (dihydrolipoamide acetyltransferase)
MALIEVRVPDIGDMSDVEVIELLVQPGDTIALDQGLMTVESDKASMEIPSTHAGIVRELAVKLGDKVSEGSLVLMIESAEAGAPGPAATAAGTDAVTEVKVPDLGDMSEVTVIELMVKPGDVVAVDQSLMTVESDKASMEIPSTDAGVVRELLVKLGDKVSEGSLILTLGSAGAAAAAPAPAAPSAPQSVAAQEPAGASTAALAIAGSDAFAALMPWPQVDFAKFGEVEYQSLSRIQKISGAALHRNWVMIPHVTNHDDADITELEAFRVQTNKEQAAAGVKITMLAFLIKACVSALQQFPQFNASLDGDRLVLKKYFHIGFAADTPAGLVVPVIKHADRKGLIEIAREMAELSARAREGKLSPAEMSGGSFSISSLGGIGGSYFTPIINAPEVAILGVGKAGIQPVWQDDKFIPRLILPLSLSWDHRVIDGAAAARFNAYLGKVLADFRLLA